MTRQGLEAVGRSGLAEEWGRLAGEKWEKLQFTLITNSGNDIRKSVMTIVQDAWRQIGVDVRTAVFECRSLSRKESTSSISMR